MPLINPGGGGGVWVKIAETVTGAGIATVTFSSIPSGYKYFIYEADFKGTQATSFTVTLNNDGAGNYDKQELLSVGSSAIAQTSAGTSSLINGGTAITNGCGLFAYINNHLTAASIYKTCTAYHGFGTIVDCTFCVWKSNTEINRIDIALGAGAFNTGARFSLYGVSV